MNVRKTSGLLVSSLIKIVILLGLYFVCKYFQLPLALTATFLLFIFLALVAITEYKKFKKPQKVLLVGLILASLLLGLLFAYDHFVNNIRITVIHVFVILFTPIAIGNYFLKKQKEKT
jgi:hypothetical protein